MFFLYLVNRRPLNTKINFKMFLEKLMPFWLKAPDPILRLAGNSNIESDLNY